ncbi:septation protein SepH [Leifsonia sp. YAF41]|uniref:septation protein SepH n=1 Tax=Leifsonia sp. YAF41 TaxID=3233086 RepID=UPI003F9616D6
MQELKVIGVENGALLAASEEGDRFRIAIDEVLQSRLRQTQSEPSNGAKLSPREIQSHIRSGMSAEDVADVTGASLDYVRRFEGPVLAEREYIVSSALSVPVHTAIDPDPTDGDANFGNVIRERLASLGATDERWASWKEPAGGWIIKLSFTADDIDHDARWGFEPKKNSLTPIGSEAIALSQQGELKGALIPRLRAVGSETSPADISRFDSGAFTFKELQNDEVLNDTAPILDPVPYARPGSTTDAVANAAIKRAVEPAATLSETADLLEALRRRRGEREAAAAPQYNETMELPTLPPSFATTPTALPTVLPTVLPTAVPNISAPDVPSISPASTADVDSEHDAAGSAPVSTPAAMRLVSDSSAVPDSDSTGSSSAESARIDAGTAAAEPDETPAPAAAPNIWATQAAKAQARNTGNLGKRGRASMPSWDEIVFGARSDDDLA